MHVSRPLRNPVLRRPLLRSLLPRSRLPQPPAPTQSHKATLDRYCVTCHSDRLKTAGLTLESIDTTNIAAAPDVWEKVVRKVRVGMMPPQGSPAPDAASRDRARVVARPASSTRTRPRIPIRAGRSCIA